MSLAAMQRYSGKRECRIFLSSLSVVCVLSLGGCAPVTESISGEAADRTIEDQIIEDRALASEISRPMPKGEVLSTRSLASIRENGLDIEVSEGSGFNRISIKSPDSIANGTSEAPKYSVKRLTAPERLVVDLDGELVTTSQNFPVTDLEYLSSVRVGSHPGKTRIVLDVAGGSEVQNADTTEDGSVVVTLSRADVAEISQETPKMAQATLIDTTQDTETKTPEVSTGVNAEPKLMPITESETIAAAPIEVAPMTVTTEKMATEQEVSPINAENTGKKAAVELTNLRLDRTGNGASVIAEASGPVEFDLIKTAPSEYVAYLTDTKLSPTLVGSTIIAPPNSTGIRTVRPVVEGDKVLLRIFAQPGTELEARASGNEVVIEMSEATTDLRAQLDPEKAAETAKESASAEPKTEAASNPAVEAAAKVTVADSGSKEVESDELSALLNDTSSYSGRLISLDLQDTDIDNALRIIAEVSNLNIVTSEDVTGKVTLRLIDVPWDQALDVILKTNGLDKVLEGSVMRIAPVGKLREEREALKEARQAEEELEPLNVKYLRISYAKASEIKPLVETVLSERGTVAYDERSNQLIVKDVKKGIRNVVELVNKIDLRTPQVLLETQIVEASRSLVRNLGAQLGFSYVASPATGNATGFNFPNSISVGGAGFNISDFSIPGDPADGASALSFLFGSADGSRNLDLRLTQLEREGNLRIVSRPAVATINNKRAMIKSVEKIRILLPTGGFSIATGAGAQAQGQGLAATEVVEVGIVLNVTPQASPDYYVLLDIDAKSSSFGTRTVQQIPSEVERAATSTVLVSSGQTFALGGIYKMTERTNVNGVPFLKDIPVIGHLFRRSLTDDSDEELLFFITPRIVEGSFDDASMKGNT